MSFFSDLTVAVLSGFSGSTSTTTSYSLLSSSGYSPIVSKGGIRGKCSCFKIGFNFFILFRPASVSDWRTARRGRRSNLVSFLFLIRLRLLTGNHLAELLIDYFYLFTLFSSSTKQKLFGYISLVYLASLESIRSL